MKVQSQHRGISRIVTVVIIIVIIAVVTVAGVYAATLSSPPSSTTSSTSSVSTTTAASSSTFSALQSTNSSQPINIGCLTSLTGSFGPNGNEAYQAANLAVNEINNNGGVDGRKLNLITLDDQTSATQGLTNARQLVSQDNVLAITCLDSSAVALAVNGYTQQNGIPMVDPIAADPSLTAPNNTWTVRLVSDSVSIGAIYAKYVTSVYPSARIAIIATQIVYFEQVAKGFQWYVQNATHASVVYDQIFPSSQSDFSTAVAAIKQSNATVIFEDLATGVSSFFTAALQAGYDQSHFFITQDEPANVIPLGSSGAGVIAGSNYNIALANSSNGVASFNQKMQAALSSCSACAKTPSLDSYFSYVAIQLIAAAIKNATSGGSLTRQSFMNALKNISYKDSILGISWKFDKTGAAPSWNYIVRISSVNPTNGTWTDEVLTYIEFPPGYVPSYKIATGS